MEDNYQIFLQKLLMLRSNSNEDQNESTNYFLSFLEESFREYFTNLHTSLLDDEFINKNKDGRSALSICLKYTLSRISPQQWAEIPIEMKNNVKLRLLILNQKSGNEIAIQNLFSQNIALVCHLDNSYTQTAQLLFMPLLENLKNFV